MKCIPVFQTDITISTLAYSENKDNLNDRFLVSLIKLYHSFIDEEYICIVMKIASYIKLILH